MAVVAPGNAPAIFDLKSASLTLVALVLKTTDLAALSDELTQRLGGTPDLFSHDPVVIDLSALADDSTPLDFAALVALLRQYKMSPIAVRGGGAAHKEAALAAGLGEAPDAPSASSHRKAAREQPQQQQQPVVQEVIKEVIREVRVEVPVEVRVEVPAAHSTAPTMIIDKPLRSGQQVYAKGGDLLVLAAVNNGAEVIADGHIHVYAPLRGKAIAGAKGNTEARIFSTCMEPELLSIAGTYRTTENPLPADVAGKPAQIRLEGERLVFEPIKL